MELTAMGSTNYFKKKRATHDVTRNRGGDFDTSDPECEYFFNNCNLNLYLVKLLINQKNGAHN